MGANYDFGGWATRNDIRCTDGRTIRNGAFKHMDGKEVPIVWNHQHNSVENVLGTAYLEHRDDGVYAYGTFNETDNGQTAKMLVQHGDITSLSIYANHLRQNGGDVLHGDIREVSLVLAGANEGAVIEEVMSHSDDDEFEAEVRMYQPLTQYEAIEHADKKPEDEEPKSESKEDSAKEPEKKEEPEMDNSSKDKTVKDVIDSMNEEQQTVLYALVGQALEEGSGTAKHSDDFEGGNDMKFNAFEQDEINSGDVLTHADQQAIFADVKRFGTLKESALQHGIEEIDMLFPEAKTMNNPPEFIKRDTDWVAKVMNAVHKTPFSRIKSLFADITEDEARAKGYIKGNLKKEEVFSLLKRTTTPTTIYKKQKFDRDDLIDITEFEVVAWIKQEMRMMLDEEIARAILVGDGRLASSDDKINESNIRPVWTDAPLYTIKAAIDAAVDVTNPDEVAKNFIRKSVKTRKDYKGSGSPVLYTTEDMLTDMLLMEDKMGRVIYDTVDKLKNVLRVSDIVTVPVMENLVRKDADTSKDMKLLGLIVNLKDYNVGADKGGAVTLFDDFDIDYNAQKYLIETRCSGALIKPYSAIAIEMDVTSAQG